ncbi:hypothetical protein KHS38_19975 [Mucilaginibacter sp. Bleaf8]|uniref:hypothetical protein n=1 Tax=Mucilaginibacter sp. Bleaf8 TaxID=2834430 RepID=UPI001BCBC25E|nr:hypothetical protein [Mucilaginibacter sp. Bleaf8]MBS7566693.1 hypothetical protein [Mucilaginibacter sp. Bleaf8]
MKKRSYKITCSLKEGYSPEGKLFEISKAETVIKEWMEQRLKEQHPIVTGLLQQGTLFFPAVAKDEKSLVTVSPTAIFTGELSSPEDMQRHDQEVRETLESLSLQLKEKLKQESVFIIYLDENWWV